MASYLGKPETMVVGSGGLRITPTSAAPNLARFSFSRARHSVNSGDPEGLPSSTHSSIADALISCAHPARPKHTTTIAILSTRGLPALPNSHISHPAR
jgi:hypothetical protein